MNTPSPVSSVPARPLPATHETVAYSPENGQVCAGHRLVAVVPVAEGVRVQICAQLKTGVNAPFVILSDEVMPEALYSAHVAPGLRPLKSASVPAPVVAPAAESAPSAMGWGGAYAEALAAKVAAVKVSDLDAFTRAYIDAALWTEEESLKQDASQHEAEYEPATRWDVNVHCIAPDALVKIVADCAKFQSENETPDYGPDRAGHDFWLTRNGHGCGFWDREELTNDQQCLLTKAAKAFGESDLYFGDDGLLYVA